MRCVWLTVCAALLLVMFTGHATASLGRRCAKLNQERCVGLGKGWFGLDNRRCFKVIRSVKTFSQAQGYCRRLCGELVSLHNVSQYNRVLCRLYYMSPRRRVSVWIGAQKRSGRFRWTDGSRWNFSRWNRGQPDNYRKREKCVEMNWGRWGHWNDQACWARRRFVCSVKCKN